MTFNDIHFGRCALVDDDGYKEYILCNLRQIQVLDGVTVTADKVAQAEEIQQAQLRAYSEAMREIEDSYHRDLQV